MVHNTKVDGTVYSIHRANAKVDGTEYSVARGKTKVGGTAYDISIKEVVTDLTDTYWKLEFDGEAAGGGYTEYNLNVITKAFPSDTGTIFYLPFRSSTSADYGVLHYYSVVGDENTVGRNTKGSTSYWGYKTKSSVVRTRNSDVQYVHIVSGSDVTNSNLLRYFNYYCTQCDSNWNPLVG